MKAHVTYAGKKKFNVKIRDFELSVDLPQEKDGDDSAPTPIELMVAALGTCAGYYVLGYLNTARIDASGLSIEAEGDLDEKGKRIARFSVSIRIPNVDLGERKQAVLAAAEKCIIHNTLKNPPDVKVLVEDKN